MSLDNIKEEEFREQIENELKSLETSKTEEASTPSIETSEEVQYSDEESQAMQQGWNPNYEGDNRVSAKEFLRVGQIIEAKRLASKEAKEYKKEVEKLSKTVTDLVEHNKQLEKSTYEKAIRELEQQQLRAVEVGDTDSFVNAKQQMDVLKEQMVTPVAPPEITQELLEFKDRNKEWFNDSNEENIEMVLAADTIDRFIAQQASRKGQVLTQNEHLTLVEDRIKKLYPHRFKNENKDKPALVAKSSVTSGKSAVSFERLDRDQRSTYESIRTVDPTYTLDMYIKQLETMGKIKK